MIRRNRDNKIKIPWYSRRVRQTEGDVEPIDGTDINIRIPPIRPRPQPVRVQEPVRQPATQPVRQPAVQPVTDPIREPVSNPVREPFPFPEPFPLPGRYPGREPQPQPGWNPPFKQPEGFPQLPGLLPMFQPGYDWEEHFKRVGEQVKQTQPAKQPEPESSNPFTEAFKKIMEPVIYLIIGREMINQYVKANITDPVYSKMLETPVLGDALREAEKAELDVEVLANYFANYDWDNMDTDQMLKDLTVLVGAAGAARIIVFFIGRKVVFRI